MSRILHILLFFIILFSSCLEPTVYNYLLFGVIADGKDRQGIDSVKIEIDFVNSKGFCCMYNKPIYSIKNGEFKISLYSWELKKNTDLLNINYGFQYSISGYMPIDTIISGHSLRLGSQGNYEDTVYLDTIYMAKM